MAAEGLAPIAAKITAAVTIPTIGIGAGAECDGQVLVTNDMLGLTGDSVPRFVKQYAAMKEMIAEAASRYCDEIRAGTFPGEEQTYRK